MLLQPRKFTWKTKQKNRTRRLFKLKPLSYGLTGVRLLQPYRTSAKRIFRFKIFLKRAARKPDLTRRALWINLFPHLPLTKKPKGMRMGKGSGKLSSWYTQLHPGVILVEFKNLRRGRSIYYAKQIDHKLSIMTQFTEHYSNCIKLSGGQRANPRSYQFY